MYAGKQSANCYKSNKCNKCSGNDITEQFVPYATIKLHDSRWHNAHYEHCCGRWVRCFQISVYKFRPVIDYDALEKQIGGNCNNIKST